MHSQSFALPHRSLHLELPRLDESDVWEGMEKECDEDPEDDERLESLREENDGDENDDRELEDEDDERDGEGIENGELCTLGMDSVTDDGEGPEPGHDGDLFDDDESELDELEDDELDEDGELDDEDEGCTEEAGVQLIDELFEEEVPELEVVEELDASVA